MPALSFEFGVWSFEKSRAPRPGLITGGAARTFGIFFLVPKLLLGNGIFGPSSAWAHLVPKER